MANRVTSTEVQEIIETDLSPLTINTYISAANLTVSAFLGSSTVLSAAQLKEIERWLTAHLMASTRVRQAQDEKAGEASIKYQGKTEMGLDGTLYGQQVKLLDTTGTLAAKLGKKKASTFAVTSFD